MTDRKDTHGGRGGHLVALAVVRIAIVIVIAVGAIGIVRSCIN